MAKYTVIITSDDSVLGLVEHVAARIGLNTKNGMRLRLLAEEMLGLVRAIAATRFSASFSIEHEGTDCTLTLSVMSELDYAKRREFLSVSSTGKNTARVGIMEKIRGIFEAALWPIEEGLAMSAEYGTAFPGYGMLGALDDGVSGVLYAWSMQKYKNEVREDPAAWDELEKSIIANIADEVSVGVRRDGVELVVRKKF